MSVQDMRKANAALIKDEGFKLISKDNKSNGKRLSGASFKPFLEDNEPSKNFEAAGNYHTTTASPLPKTTAETSFNERRKKTSIPHLPTIEGSVQSLDLGKKPVFFKCLSATSIDNMQKRAAMNSGESVIRL